MPVQVFQRASNGLGRGALIAFIAALPLLLITVLVYRESARQAQVDAQTAAKVVLQHTDSILSYVTQASRDVLPLASQPCDAVLQQLLETAAYRPYFRSVLLVDNDFVYCSSSAGSRGADLDSLKLRHLFKPENDGQVFMVPSTRNVPERPAFIFVQSQQAGRGVVSYVDSRYIFDIMSAVGNIQKFAVSLAFDEATINGEFDAIGEFSRRPGFEYTETARNGKISVTVGVPESVLAVYRRECWVSFLPFGLLGALVLGYLVNVFYRQRMSMAEDIRRAMKRGEFYVCYQPIVDLNGGHCRGAEVLMRWTHPSGKEVPPDLFFAAADEAALSIPLTLHLFKMVSRDLQAWALPPGFRLNLNIAAQHLAHEDLIDDVMQLVVGLPTPTPIIVLEITERNVVPDDPLVISNMVALRALGMEFAIDDFGTGQSALSYLEKLPVDYLKVDRSFVSAIDSGALRAPVLDTIIALATRLELTVVAEGIETPAQAEYLRQLGVPEGQGFLFATPMRAADFRVWSRSRQANFPSQARMTPG